MCSVSRKFGCVNFNDFPNYIVGSCVWSNEPNIITENDYVENTRNQFPVSFERKSKSKCDSWNSHPIPYTCLIIGCVGSHVHGHAHNHAHGRARIHIHEDWRSCWCCSRSRSREHSINHAIKHWMNHSINQSLNSAINLSIEHSIKHSILQSINHSINLSINHAARQPVNHWFNRWFKHWLNYSINRQTDPARPHEIWCHGNVWGAIRATTHSTI